MAIWTPNMYATEPFLFDFGDAATITLVDGKVSSVTDKYGKAAAATQGTDAARPSIATASLNGLDTLLLDGTNDFLSLGTTLGKPESYTLFVVTKPTKALSNNQAAIMSSDSTGSSAKTWGAVMNSGSQAGKMLWQYGDGSAYRYGYAAGAFTINTWCQLCLVHTSGTQDEAAYRDGSVLGNSGQAGAATACTGTAYDMAIGRGGSYNGFYFGGEIALVIYLPIALSLADIQLFDGWIAHHCGIAASLPTDHPYKSAAPTADALSGVVTVNSSPVQRTVLVYKNDDADLFMSTQSDATTGEWHVNVGGVETDRYRVVLVGESGEYSKVFEDVTAW